MDPVDEIGRICDDAEGDKLSRIATVLGMDKVEEQRDNLAGLLKRCAVLLPEKHPARKAAVGYLKEHSYFNILRKAASGVRAVSQDAQHQRNGDTK